MFMVKITIIYYWAIFPMYCLCVDVTSPRQIPMHILTSLANKLPCILSLKRRGLNDGGNTEAREGKRGGSNVLEKETF